MSLLDRCGHLDPESRRLLAFRVGELIDYQDARYAATYVDFVLVVAAREEAMAAGRREITHAVIRNLYKLMAYKDEYEVARLHLKPAFQAGTRGLFTAPRRLDWHFHPPLLRALGLRRKLRLGPWFAPVLRALRALRRVRGTPFDLFGYAAVRREERRLIPWYRELVTSALDGPGADGHARALELARLPESIRGYEDIKLRSIAKVRGQALTLTSTALHQPIDLTSRGCDPRTAAGRRPGPRCSSSRRSGPARRPRPSPDSRDGGPARTPPALVPGSPCVPAPGRGGLSTVDVKTAGHERSARARAALARTAVRPTGRRRGPPRCASGAGVPDLIAAPSVSPATSRM